MLDRRDDVTNGSILVSEEISLRLEIFGTNVFHFELCILHLLGHGRFEIRSFGRKARHVNVQRLGKFLQVGQSLNCVFGFGASCDGRDSSSCNDFV